MNGSDHNLFHDGMVSSSLSAIHYSYEKDSRGNIEEEDINIIITWVMQINKDIHPSIHPSVARYVPFRDDLCNIGSFPLMLLVMNLSGVTCVTVAASHHIVQSYL